jgi:pilus assembly protein CpaE
MNESHNQTYLALTRNQDDLQWLQGALAPLGQVIGANGPSLDELLALVDMTFSNLVFIGLDREQLIAQCALIEGEPEQQARKQTCQQLHGDQLLTTDDE